MVNNNSNISYKFLCRALGATSLREDFAIIHMAASSFLESYVRIQE